MPSNDFEQIVSQYYEALYRFALSLTRREDDARDLTQQTFYIWATKGHQLRDRSKVKAWLFTILHREFLYIRKRAVRFPHFELSDANVELPTISPTIHTKTSRISSKSHSAPFGRAFPGGSRSSSD